MTTVEIDDEATQKITGLVEGNKQELTRDAMMFWFEKSQKHLAEAAEQRQKLGSAKGQTGREETSLSKIQQGAVPPQWDQDREEWAFSYPHRGAIFNEFGARSHEVRAKKAEVLAFEWPDAPEKVQEQFDHTEGDLVYFESVNHPGLPGIGFVRRGRDLTAERLENRGISTTMSDSA